MKLLKDKEATTDFEGCSPRWLLALINSGAWRRYFPDKGIHTPLLSFTVYYCLFGSSFRRGLYHAAENYSIYLLIYVCLNCRQSICFLLVWIWPWISIIYWLLLSCIFLKMDISQMMMGQKTDVEWRWFKHMPAWRLSVCQRCLTGMFWAEGYSYQQRLKSSGKEKKMEGFVEMELDGEGTSMLFQLFTLMGQDFLCFYWNFGNDWHNFPSFYG